jgi:hypothetical protein
MFFTHPSFLDLLTFIFKTQGTFPSQKLIQRFLFEMPVKDCRRKRKHRERQQSLEATNLTVVINKLN